MFVSVLRLGHRVIRDARMTTHVALAARAFGAGECIIEGEQDSKLVEGVTRVAERWGGAFEIRQERNWKRIAEKFKKEGFAIVHLTMYGERVQDKEGEIRKKEKILVVVGGEKVPSEMFKLADYNVSVTSQPHSEVAALAVFLDRLFEGRELEKDFEKAWVKVVPSAKGKKIE